MCTWGLIIGSPSLYVSIYETFLKPCEDLVTVSSMLLYGAAAPVPSYPSHGAELGSSGSVKSRGTLARGNPTDKRLPNVSRNFNI